MDISNTKKNFLIWLTIIMVSAAILVYLGLKFLLPGHYFVWYPTIPAFFYIFGWYYIFTFDRCRRYSPNKMLSVYIGMKVVKMLLSILIIVFYMLFVKVQKSDFIMTFFLFYLLSILYETVYFYWFERNKDKSRKNEIS